MFLKKRKKNFFFVTQLKFLSEETFSNIQHVSELLCSTLQQEVEKTQAGGSD